MKNLKLVLWYLFVVPHFVLVILMGIVEVLMMFIRAVFAVIGVVSFRYECWSYGVKRDEIVNCPWKKTLQQVFCDEIKNYK